MCEKSHSFLYVSKYNTVISFAGLMILIFGPEFGQTTIRYNLGICFRKKIMWVRVPGFVFRMKFSDGSHAVYDHAILE